MFPGDIVEINAPEEDVLFHGEHDELGPSNDHQQQEEDLATGGEIRENRDNTPQRLSPPRRYVPAGAESGESSPSSSTCDEEDTVEEGLARFFGNPSYRAADSPCAVTITDCTGTSTTIIKNSEETEIFTEKKRKEETT